MIDIFDVYEPKIFSIMPELSGDLILGMDSWLNFMVFVGTFSKTWTLKGGNSSGRTLVVDDALSPNPYCSSEVIRKFIHEETDRLLKAGYITRSNNEWACSPVSGLRFCINYQSLNQQSKKPASLPLT